MPWDVHDPVNAIAIDPAHERHPRPIVEVADLATAAPPNRAHLVEPLD